MENQEFGYIIHKMGGKVDSGIILQQRLYTALLFVVELQGNIRGRLATICVQK